MNWKHFHAVDSDEEIAKYTETKLSFHEYKLVILPSVYQAISPQHIAVTTQVIVLFSLNTTLYLLCKIDTCFAYKV
jgi:hypothetical protein